MQMHIRPLKTRECVSIPSDRVILSDQRIRELARNAEIVSIPSDRVILSDGGTMKITPFDYSVSIPSDRVILSDVMVNVDEWELYKSLNPL